MALNMLDPPKHECTPNSIKMIVFLSDGIANKVSSDDRQQ